MKAPIVFGVFFLLFPLISVAQKSTVINGVYQGLGNLNIIVDQKGIKGYFQNYRGRQSSFSTILFFFGNKINNKRLGTYQIKTFYPGDADTIKGICQILNSSNLNIILDETPPGDVFSIDHYKDSFQILKQKNWKGFAYVISNKVRLMTKPNNTSKSIGYIIKNDCVAIIKNYGDWLQIEYLGINNNSIAWIRKKEIKLL